jgi:3-hydroxyacyl-CoA dehydrogenase
MVAAVQGYCLGGGFELALGCARIVAAAESQIGLPESRVGLIPGGRGNALMRLNNQFSARQLVDIAITMTEGKVSGSADEARVLGYLRPDDLTSTHPDRLIADAKRVALQRPVAVRPAWNPTVGPVIGMIDRRQAELRAEGMLTEYDETIGDKIKSLLAKTGDYAECVVRERTHFLDLCQRALTVARLRHMIETGKPLRN